MAANDQLVLAPNALERSGVPGRISPLLIIILGLALPAVLGYALATSNEAMVTGVVIAAAAALVLIAKPFWGLLGVIALIYVRPEEAIPALAGMHFTLLVSLVTLVGMAVKLSMDRQKLVRTPLNWLIPGFALIGVLSTLDTGNSAEAAQDLAKLVILVLVIINLIRTPRDLRAFVTTLIVFTAFVAAYSIFLEATGHSIQDQDTERSLATGIFGDPNDLAATLAAGLALIVSRIMQTQGVRRAGYAGLVLLLLYAIFLTNSRGGLLAIITVFTGYLIVFSRKRFLGILLAIVVAAGFLAFAPGRMGEMDSGEESANSRFWFWDTGISIMKDRPLSGVGYGQFPDYNGGMTAHNSFVLCFAELGLPGFFFWMGSLYFCFRSRKPAVEGEVQARPDPTQMGIRIALAGFLTACFWLSRTYTPILYILIALPIASNTSAAESASKPPLRLSWPREALNIAALCAASIVFIQLMVEHYK